ncbi:MAG: methyltransferase domain-containing protein [Oscillospiraceae bacterium]|nr:methyltransferase domain-containing protein [Oscillospiraceae bacterium]
MSKYDFKIDLSENTSTGLILKKIRPGSTVLEFGCATGRMTRYMQEELHCQVYIVEIDKEAYETALQYAADGVCGDIMDMEWKEKFSDILFDHILFADVLEHLPDPDFAVREAAKLLVPEGNIIFSIPNITHNDIILKAISDHFDYTDVGLLDNTHIHFWGLKNIKPFAEKNGLFIHSIDATFCDTGCSEQYKGDLRNIPTILLNILNERDFGNVYQFVCTMERQIPENKVMLSSKKTGIISSLYIDLGQGFDEEDKLCFRTEAAEDGSYILNYVLENTEKIQKIRFDPVEGQGCILKNLMICQGDEVLTMSFSSSISLDNGVLLIGNDPMVSVTLLSDSAPVEIKAQILLISDAEYVDTLIGNIRYVRMYADSLKADNDTLKSDYDNLKADNEALKSEYDNLKADNDILKSDYDILKADNTALKSDYNNLKADNDILKSDYNNLKADNDILKSDYDSLKADNKALKSDYDNLKADNEDLKTDYGKLITENANLKEALLAESIRNNAYAQLVDAKEEMLILYKQRNDELLNKISELTDQINMYQSRKCVRLADMLGRKFRK